MPCTVLMLTGKTENDGISPHAHVSIHSHLHNTNLWLVENYYLSFKVLQKHSIITKIKN